MLGVGDFYYELGIQIVEVCMSTSHRNGGTVLNQIKNYITQLLQLITSLDYDFFLLHLHLKRPLIYLLCTMTTALQKSLD